MLLWGTLCLFGKGKTKDLGMALVPSCPFEESPGATAVCSTSDCQHSLQKTTSGGSLLPGLAASFLQEEKKEKTKTQKISGCPFQICTGFSSPLSP